MELKKKLEIAYDLACAFDAVPEAGYSLKDLQDIYRAYKEDLIGIDLGEVSFLEGTYKSLSEDIETIKKAKDENIN